jgi:hypothetical protein
MVIRCLTPIIRISATRTGRVAKLLSNMIAAVKYIAHKPTIRRLNTLKRMEGGYLST